MDALGLHQALAIKLARQNINITSITPDFVMFDYQFRLRNGQTRWAKMFYKRNPQDESIRTMVEDILEIVRASRMEVEENEWK